MSRPKTIPCPNCGGAKRLDNINPGESFRCPCCEGVGTLSPDTPSFDDLVNLAALELPEGWRINLCVGHHEGWVELVDPDGNEVDFATNHEFIGETFADAIEHAMNAEETTP